MSATSRPRRLTRAESQQRTRELVIEAATRLFLSQGFAATSLEQVAEEAGFTRGAVYSNFAGKTAIGIAVIDALYEREERRLEAALSQLDDRDAVLNALSRWAGETLGDPAWSRLEIEVAASSGGDDEYRAATAARYERQRERCADFLAGLLGDDLGDQRPVLASAMLGLALGLGMQRWADPEIPGSQLGEAIRLIGAPRR